MSTSEQPSVIPSTQPSKHHRGVPTVKARRRLASVLDKYLQDLSGGEHLPSYFGVWCQKIFRTQENICLLLCAAVLVVAYALSSARQTPTVIQAGIVVVTVLLNAGIGALYHRCKALELRVALTSACQDFARAARLAELTAPLDTEPSKGRRQSGAGLLQGSPLVSIVSVYRDSLWQRVPRLLLVEDDIIALQGGDLCPGKAELLSFKPSHSRADSPPDAASHSGGGRPRKPEVPWFNPQPSHPHAQGQGAALSPPLAWESAGATVQAGERIQLRPQARTQFPKRAMVPGLSPALLLLCGDTRCYRLLETPLENYLKNTLLPSGAAGAAGLPAEPLLHKRLRDARRKIHRILAVMVAIQFIIGVVRLAITGELRGDWTRYLLVLPVQVALCLLPLALPLCIAFGEAALTGRMMAFFEMVLLQKRYKNVQRAAAARHGGGSKAAVPVTGPDSSDESFDEFDVQARQDIVSTAQHLVSYKRTLSYSLATWRARRRCGLGPAVPSGGLTRPNPDPPSIDETADGDIEMGVSGYRSPCSDAEDFVRSGLLSGEEGGDGGLNARSASSVRRRFSVASWLVSLRSVSQGGTSGRRPSGGGRRRRETSTEPKGLGPRLPLLAVPLLGCSLVERLGAATMVCMLDEDTVCEPFSAVEEIFMLNAKDDAGSGTVLDLHTDSSEKGVRFEDPQWSQHLSSLKPIGLTCLVAEGGQRHMEGHRWVSGQRTPTLSLQRRPLGESRHHHKHHRKRPDKALLEHVRQTVPMEHLRDLWREIGFSEADRAAFRERRRIHVIDPILASARAMEDTHAQGQEETRRRGTIQPHVNGVVVEDRRTRALQLLSQGNPSIVLAMCSDYWDGATISPLPASLQRAILDMHQQWSLEDLDVVAFAYTPVPYTVQPFLSSVSKHPDYLVYAKAAEEKPQQRAPPLPYSRRKTSSHVSLGAGRKLGSSRGSALGLSTLQEPDDEHALSEGESPAPAEGQGSTIPPFLSRDLQSETALLHKTSLSGPESSSPVPSGRSVSPLARGQGPQELSPRSAGGGSGAEPSPARHLNKIWRSYPSKGSAGSPLLQGVTKGPGAVAATTPAAGGVGLRPGTAPEHRMLTPPSGLQAGGAPAGLTPLVLDVGGAARTANTSPRPVATGRRTTLRKPRRRSVDDFGVNMPRRGDKRSRHAGLAVAAMAPSDDGPATEALWNLVHEQVFLGMVASSVPPKRGMTSLIEDMSAAGVRFVYFSPRNMRRSKAIAENMGIETDWNCAISLRPLDSPNTPDPHRMTSSYADWDVKARLPHGIPAIREHIAKVDNVPLLVSLFTDATWTTTMEMLEIFQEHDESLLCVGTSYRASNGILFRRADLAMSLEGLPLEQPISTLPAASPWEFSASDALLNSALVGLHAALPLGDVARKGGGLEDVQAVLIDLIRESRRLLCNVYQALAFFFTANFTLAALLVTGSALPVSRAPVPDCALITWLLWVVIPLLSLSLLASPADANLMRRMPEKNSAKAVPISWVHLRQLLVRAAPTVVGCLGVYVFTSARLLREADPAAVAGCGGSWLAGLWCGRLDGEPPSPSENRAIGQAMDIMAAELVLCLAVQSAGYMYRMFGVVQEHPWRSWVWAWTVPLVLLLQFTYTWVAAAVRGSVPLLLHVPWQVLLAGALWPMMVLVTGEVVKKKDAKKYRRYLTLLRLEFDTRLGMHSPR